MAFPQSPRRRLRRSVQALVEDLGPTPDTIGRSLASYNVRGVPGDGSDCAIARYLRAVIGTEPSVADVFVSERWLRVTRRGCRPPISITLSAATSSFVRGFDTGSFPQLVAQGSDVGGA